MQLFPMFCDTCLYLVWEHWFPCPITHTVFFNYLIFLYLNHLTFKKGPKIILNSKILLITKFIHFKYIHMYNHTKQGTSRSKLPRWFCPLSFVHFIEILQAKDMWKLLTMFGQSVNGVTIHILVLLPFYWTVVKHTNAKLKN